MSVGVEDAIFKLLQKLAPEKELLEAVLLLLLQVNVASLAVLAGGGCSESGVFSAMTSSSLFTHSTMSWMLRLVTEQRLSRRDLK
jgi:hypothetical protein